ncbi:MAG TPA: HEAT repeat domain-containing protein [Cyclobacteriaceae bacterium]|nr:HEAT repeat domain-containing protein [Cyclobacteriaceae bacterium]
MDNSSIDLLIEKLMDKNEQEAFKYAEKLAAIGGEEVYHKTLELLRSEDWEVSSLAAKVLSRLEQREQALNILMEIIHDKSNALRSGELVEALEAFDLSNHFVDVLRIYLFGNYKASALAKEYLDHTEFDITPRVIKKALKHWKHYQNNVKKDEAYEIKEREVEAIFRDLDELFS